MTERQREILVTINKYIEKEGISPTVREIGQIVGLRSSSTVHNHIKALEKEGYIKMKKDSPRSMRVIKKALS